MNSSMPAIALLTVAVIRAVMENRAPARRAVAILATLTRPINWKGLTGDFGWSFDEAEAWLTEMFTRELLAAPVAGSTWRPGVS